MEKLNKEFLIGSINIKNERRNRLNLLFEKIRPSEIIEKHIEKYNYDILGTQELTRFLLKKINLKGYEKVEFYRLGNFFHFPKQYNYNEGNITFTKHKVLKKESYYLPFFPSIPRTVTLTLILLNEQKIWILNTHLERKNERIREKQFAKLEELIKKCSEEALVILMGDFNTSIYNSNFKTFIANLGELGLKRVEINEKTQIKRKNAIDHIFIPKSCKVLEKGLINDNELNKITDHFGVYVKVKQDL